MSAVRLVKQDRQPQEPPAGFTPEQWEAIEARIARAEQGSRLDRLYEALFRACVVVGRAVRPEKRWDGL